MDLQGPNFSDSRDRIRSLKRLKKTCYNNNNIFIGVMVHITGTRAKKVVSYTSAHSTEMVFAQDKY